MGVAAEAVVEGKPTLSLRNELAPDLVRRPRSSRVSRMACPVAEERVLVIWPCAEEKREERRRGPL